MSDNKNKENTDAVKSNIAKYSYQPIKKPGVIIGAYTPSSKNDSKTPQAPKPIPPHGGSAQQDK